MSHFIRVINNLIIKQRPPLYSDKVPMSPIINFRGIGALVVKNDVSRYAEKAGLYVLTQTSEGGAALANRKTFRAKEFS